MARPVVFKQVDVTRAVKGAIIGGLAVGRVEIDPVSGRIILSAIEQKAEPENPLDAWMKNHAG